MTTAVKLQSLKDSIIEAYKSNAEAGANFENIEEAIQLCLDSYSETPYHYGFESIDELGDALIEKYPYILKYFTEQ
jgi:hypothetical protein